MSYGSASGRKPNKALLHVLPYREWGRYGAAARKKVLPEITEMSTGVSGDVYGRFIAAKLTRVLH